MIAAFAASRVRWTSPSYPSSPARRSRPWLPAAPGVWGYIWLRRTVAAWRALPDTGAARRGFRDAAAPFDYAKGRTGKCRPADDDKTLRIAEHSTLAMTAWHKSPRTHLWPAGVAAGLSVALWPATLLALPPSLERGGAETIDPLARVHRPLISVHQG
jgi:hypothetical protein